MRSWLCELAERAFAEEGNDLEALKGHVSDSGEGRWTIVDAIDLDVPTPVITASLYARFYSRGEGDYTHRVLAGAAQPVRRPRGRARGRELSDGRRHAPTPEHENPLIEGLERLPVPPTTLVIFGATGDLAHRKLLPALYNLAHEGALPERFKLIGVARREKGRDDFREEARESICEYSRREPDDEVLDGLLEHVQYIASNFDDPDGLQGARGGARRARRGGRPAAHTATTTSRPRRSSSP